MIRWKSPPCPQQRWQDRQISPHTGKDHGEQAAEKPSYFESECRHCGKYGHKAADCWHKRPKPQGKGKGKAKSKVSEVSETASLPHTSGLSQVHTIKEVGCVDEGLWIFSLEDSTENPHKVSWDELWFERSTSRITITSLWSILDVSGITSPAILRTGNCLLSHDDEQW